MNIKIKSLSKNEDFKKLLNGRKISNSYLTVFFKKIPDKKNTCLNISFVAKKKMGKAVDRNKIKSCLLYTSPSPRDQRGSRMPSSA